MILKMIDLSLMANHLKVHKAELAKLRNIICTVPNQKIKQVATEQYMIMKNHVYVMIALMNPNQNESVSVESLHHWELPQFDCDQTCSGVDEKDTLIDLQSSADFMAQNNFQSALRMQADNVRNIHFHMAFQQTMIFNKYVALIKELTEDTAPESSLKKQEETYHKFKEMFQL